MEKELLYPELSYFITGLCFKLHNSMGRFCKEKQYADELEKIFQKNGIPYQREQDLNAVNQLSPKGNRVDFIVFKRIVIELKAKKFTTKEDYYQVKRYLYASKLRLGLLVNFRCPYLKPKRILLKQPE